MKVFRSREEAEKALIPAPPTGNYQRQWLRCRTCQRVAAPRTQDQLPAEPPAPAQEPDQRPWYRRWAWMWGGS